MGGVVFSAMDLVSLVCSCWADMVVTARLVAFGICSGAGRGLGGADLWASSIWFTLEALDLVLMAGAGDSEMGGEGESSLVIAGIGRG